MSWLYGIEKHPSAVVHDHEKSIILQGDRITIEAYARIDGLVRLQGGEGLYIGEHVHIGSFSTLNAGGGTVFFGDHSGCSNGCVIAAGMPDLDYTKISAAEWIEDIHKITKITQIGRYVCIFANAIILPGVTIGDYAVIGAGAVVTKDVKKGHIVVGNPARTVDIRDIGNLK